MFESLNRGGKSIKTETDIKRIIEEDTWMMRILHTAKLLNVPDWWICAGFVRSKMWDTLHEYSDRTSLPDIDVIYYDLTDTSETKEKELEAQLKSYDSTIPWSVKNQARMHHANNVPPYISSVDAMSKFPETATALGVTLDHEGNLILSAPCGIQDVINLEVRPTPYFKETNERMQIYTERVLNKKWWTRWPKVKIYKDNLF